MIGKERRLSRLLVGPDKRCVMIPMDHAPWLGPLAGIDQPREITAKVIAGGANALLVTPGFLRSVHDLVPPEVGIVLRVSVSAGLSTEAVQEVPAVTAATAILHDVDAVAVSVFFGRGGEVSLIHWLGELIQECAGYGIPVIAEMMPPSDVFYDPDKIAHAARIGMELGADIVKTNYCGDIARFARVVCSTVVPIIVAGGPSQNGADNTLQVAQDAISAGAAGVAFGRRVWQAGDPEKVVSGLRDIVFSTRRLTGGATL
jgi:DhnA family fructose-bisphosphate aldolase class Ia